MTPATGNKLDGPILRRVLGPIDATGIVVGAVIGVGIFFTPSRVARVAGGGEWALAAWAVGGVIAMLGALTFAELGSRYERSAGQYEILRDAYGPLVGFLFVFCNSTAIQSGATAIIAIVCAVNLGVALRGAAPSSAGVTTTAVLLIVSVIIANVLGVRWGAVIQNATSLARVATLLLIASLAVWAGARGESTAAVPEPTDAAGSLTALLAAVVPTAFTYGGWQHALWIGGEVREPRRNVPRAIIAGMVVVVVVYLLVNWAYLSLLGYAGVANSPALAADAVARVWPRVGQRLIAAAVGLSALGVLNAQLLSGPRLVYGMAADGRFFGAFARLSRFGTPYAAILLIGGIGLALVLAAGERAIDRLLTGVVAIDGVFFALTGGALFLLRRRDGRAAAAVRVPGYPLVPIAFVLCELCVVAGAFLDPAVREAAVIGAVWILGAGLCYGLFFRCARS